MARSDDSSDTIESVQLGESGGYDGSGVLTLPRFFVDFVLCTKANIK